MTKSDYLDWKHHPITEEIFEVFRRRHDELIEMLISQSAYGHNEDARASAAAIKVYREILNMSPEEVYDH